MSFGDSTYETDQRASLNNNLGADEDLSDFPVLDKSGWPMIEKARIDHDLFVRKFSTEVYYALARLAESISEDGKITLTICSSFDPIEPVALHAQGSHCTSVYVKGSDVDEALRRLVAELAMQEGPESERR